SAAARFTVVVVFPTPPFWLAIVTTLRSAGRGHCWGRVGAGSGFSAVSRETSAASTSVVVSRETSAGSCPIGTDQAGDAGTSATCASGVSTDPPSTGSGRSLASVNGQPSEPSSAERAAGHPSPELTGSP